MIDFLACLIASRSIETQAGETAGFQWEYWGEGLLVFSPKAGYRKSLILSAGIHGNETAPIELLSKITDDLFNGALQLNIRLMCVLGNPDAIRLGRRYIEHDMNRMFDGAYQHLPVHAESQRALVLEHAVQRFIQDADQGTRHYHFDLHTAIRSSLLPTFALFPFQSHAYDEYVLQCLASADLDAVVFHQALGHTFSHFSSHCLGIASVTLELGQAKAFGENDLDQFKAIDRVLRTVIEAGALRERSKARLRQFKVIDSIVKMAEDFELQVASDVANFTAFQQGEVIATQGHDMLDADHDAGDQAEDKTSRKDLSHENLSTAVIAKQNVEQIKDYVVQQPQVFLLFPNAKVKVGLRAGLILEEI